MVLTFPVYSLRYGPNVACLLSSFSITTLRSQLTTLSHTVKNCSKWSFFFDCRWWHYWSLFPVKSPETILSIGDNLLANRPKYRSEIFSPISGIFQQFCVKIWPGPGNSDGGKKTFGILSVESVPKMRKRVTRSLDRLSSQCAILPFLSLI